LNLKWRDQMEGNERQSLWVSQKVSPS